MFALQLANSPYHNISINELVPGLGQNLEEHHHTETELNVFNQPLYVQNTSDMFRLK